VLHKLIRSGLTQRSEKPLLFVILSEAKNLVVCESPEDNACNSPAAGLLHRLKTCYPLLTLSTLSLGFKESIMFIVEAVLGRPCSLVPAFEPSNHVAKNSPVFRQNRAKWHPKRFGNLAPTFSCGGVWGFCGGLLPGNLNPQGENRLKRAPNRTITAIPTPKTPCPPSPSIVHYRRPSSIVLLPSSFFLLPSSLPSLIPPDCAPIHRAL
jgi:hypothetical protein